MSRHEREIEDLQRENASLLARVRELEATAAAHEPGSELRALLDAVPEIVVLLDRNLTVVEANSTFCRRWSCTRADVVGTSIERLLDPATLARRRRWLEQVVRTRQTETFVDERAGRTFETIIHPILSDSGEVRRLAVFARDITPRGRAEHQLRELLENVRLVAVILDTRGYVTLANSFLAHITGRTTEEMEGSDWFETFIPEEQREEIRIVFRRTLEQGDVPSHHENEIVTAAGERRMIRWSNSVLRDEGGAVVSVASLGEDVTERRQEQEALLQSREWLRALATQLSTVEDHERRRFATALHDEVSQELVVLRLKITALLARTPRQLRAELEDLQRLLGACLDRTRRLTYDLSPPVLYELGLEPALQTIGEQMAREHGLEFQFAARGNAEPLADELAPVLFRVVRELIMNVIKHAHATTVRVEVRRDFPFVAAVVEDDGRGFAPGWERMDEGMDRFGLFSIRERMRQLGGTLEVGRSALGGAVVVVTCPLASTGSAPGR